MAGEDIYNLGIKALITNSSGEILILQVNKEELIDEDTAYWDVPGGRVKQGESVSQTLKKEIAEETGLSLGSYTPLDSIISNIRIPQKSGDTVGVGLILFIYRCTVTDEKGDIKLSREHQNYKWADVDEAQELLKYKYPDSFIKKLNAIKSSAPAPGES